MIRLGRTVGLKCTIMRAGTSKGIFVNRNDLPQDPELRDRVAFALFGSPDVRQIDGLGGADPLTSKLAIIGASSRADADVDYTFGQVSIKSALVDYSGNCGNISSAVGPYAIEAGYVQPTSPVTRVRIHNTNTNKLIYAEVPVEEGSVVYTGDYAIDGVPGTGSRIMLDFHDAAGSSGRGILPTGRPLDHIDVRGFAGLAASIVDAANPCVFVKAGDLGLSGSESPREIDSNRELLDTLEEIRSVAAEMIGMVANRKDAVGICPAFPMVAFVGVPADYGSFTTGGRVSADSIDFVSRMMFMQTCHKTYPITGTICTGVAAVIGGTIVNDVAGRAYGSGTGPHTVRIGHPSGVVDVEVRVASRSGVLSLERAAVGRTARRLMDGIAYLPGEFR